MWFFLLKPPFRVNPCFSVACIFWSVFFRGLYRLVRVFPWPVSFRSMRRWIIPASPARTSDRSSLAAWG